MTALLLAGATRLQAACPGCTAFNPGTVWGYATTNGLSEASGLASSSRNPGVLWTHNDGSREKVLALSTNGTLLATFALGKNVDDLEDVAVGPGPTNGVSYLYLADIGGSAGTNVVRPDVKILRLPEPGVELAWADKPRTPAFKDVDTFTLAYPDGSYDAETLLVDPLTSDLFILTKQPGVARIYRANLNAATNKSTLTLEWVSSIPFGQASGGDISPDGTQIIVRREEYALLWTRCTNETVGTALSRPGTPVPVMGPPAEPNGEAIAFLRDGTGYVTLSEGIQQPIYFFQALCPMPPRITLFPSNQSSFVGGSMRMEGLAVGYPSPSFQWRLNGQPIPGQTNPSLVLSGLDFANAGNYSFVASNASGVAISTASLMIRPKPDLRITEVMPAPAASPGLPTADWWELTSFESEPVHLAGWRLNDNSGAFSDPYVISGPLTINPGESIIFVEDLPAAQFHAWWGSANLPHSLQVATYSGSGLSLGAAGDGLRLWDNMTTDPNNPVAQVNFGPADPGVSFNYDPVLEQFGGKSQLGMNGVVRAAAATDLGSPGRIIAPALGPMLTVVKQGTSLRIEFDAAYGRVYSLEASEDLSSWSPTGDTLQPGNNMRASFMLEETTPRRFFRVRVQ